MGLGYTASSGLGARCLVVHDKPLVISSVYFHMYIRRINIELASNLLVVFISNRARKFVHLGLDHCLRVRSVRVITIIILVLDFSGVKCLQRHDLRDHRLIKQSRFIKILHNFLSNLFLRVIVVENDGPILRANYKTTDCDKLQLLALTETLAYHHTLGD